MNLLTEIFLQQIYEQISIFEKKSIHLEQYPHTG